MAGRLATASQMKQRAAMKAQPFTKADLLPSPPPSSWWCDLTRDAFSRAAAFHQWRMAKRVWRTVSDVTPNV